jgi:hemoglobin
MKRTSAWGGLLLFVMMLGLGACASMRGQAEPSLYKRLGGREGIRGVVDDFVAALVADPRVNARFKDLKPADVERVKTNISDQVCEATGGPCSYLGKDMKTAHKDMRITEAEWTAGVEDLVKALDKRGVSQKDRNELLGLLSPMKNDIVNQ